MLYYQVACTLISVFVSSTQNEAYEGRFRWAACIPLLSLKRRDDQSNAALLTSHCVRRDRRVAVRPWDGSSNDQLADVVGLGMKRQCFCNSIIARHDTPVGSCLRRDKLRAIRTRRISNESCGP